MPTSGCCVHMLSPTKKKSQSHLCTEGRSSTNRWKTWESKTDIWSLQQPKLSLHRGLRAAAIPSHSKTLMTRLHLKASGLTSARLSRMERRSRLQWLTKPPFFWMRRGLQLLMHSWCWNRWILMARKWPSLSVCKWSMGRQQLFWKTSSKKHATGGTSWFCWGTPATRHQLARTFMLYLCPKSSLRHTTACMLDGHLMQLVVSLQWVQNCVWSRFHARFLYNPMPALLCPKNPLDFAKIICHIEGAHEFWEPPDGDEVFIREICKSTETAALWPFWFHLCPARFRARHHLASQFRSFSPFVEGSLVSLEVFWGFWKCECVVACLYNLFFLDALDNKKFKSIILESHCMNMALLEWFGMCLALRETSFTANPPTCVYSQPANMRLQPTRQHAFTANKPTCVYSQQASDTFANRIVVARSSLM